MAGSLHRGLLLVSCKRAAAPPPPRRSRRPHPRPHPHCAARSEPFTRRPTATAATAGAALSCRISLLHATPRHRPSRHARIDPQLPLARIKTKRTKSEEGGRAIAKFLACPPPSRFWEPQTPNQIETRARFQSTDPFEQWHAIVHLFRACRGGRAQGGRAVDSGIHLQRRNGSLQSPTAGGDDASSQMMRGPAGRGGVVYDHAHRCAGLVARNVLSNEVSSLGAVGAVGQVGGRLEMLGELAVRVESGRMMQLIASY